MTKLLVLGVLALVFSIAKFHFSKPEHFPEPYYNFSENELSEEKIKLGRALFYDNILSFDSTISCASCHSVYNSFAHTDHNRSHGIQNRIGRRNAPVLINLAWQPLFMWDGAINHLDVQSLAPLTHPDEMGNNLMNLLSRLRSSRLYPALFESAFGDTIISSERFLKSIAQFMLTLVSSNSKYDRVKRSEVSFTAQEQKGYSLFKQHCNICHREPLFSDYSFRNNGLPVNSDINDSGRVAISLKSEDRYSFKVPTLRNLAYSYPYMHDGRFTRLSQVLKHYTLPEGNQGIVDPSLAKGIQLTESDKTDLTAFLLTLNDSSFVFNRSFGYPFNIFSADKP
jgi:cytochrome c peroxidase